MATFLDFQTMFPLIEDRFKTLVEDVVTGLAGRVQYTNSPELQLTSKQTQWWRLTVEIGDSFRVENGGSPGKHRFRTPGLLRAEGFIPTGKGVSELMPTVDAIKDVFRAQSVGGVTYTTPKVQTTGQTGAEYRITVRNTFWSDDLG